MNNHNDGSNARRLFSGGGSMQKLFVANVNIFREPSIIAKKSARLQDVPSELNF